MTLVGAPDFQTQQAPTSTLIATITVTSLSGTQTTDISGAILPYHQAIQIYWVASGADPNNPIDVQVIWALNNTLFVAETNIFDGTSRTERLPGAAIVNNPGSALNLVCKPSPIGTSPVSGTLFVFGYTALPVVIPAVRGRDIGFGTTTGAIGCPGAATTTILALPPVGTYYQIRGFWFTYSAAPAANSIVQFQQLSNAAVIAQYRATGSQSQDIHAFFDWSIGDGITVNNQSLAAGNAGVIFERWQS